MSQNFATKSLGVSREAMHKEVFPSWHWAAKLFKRLLGEAAGCLALLATMCYQSQVLEKPHV